MMPIVRIATMFHALRRRIRGDSGIEYALLLGLIALVAVGTVAATGGEITRILCAAGNFVGRDVCSAPGGGPGNGGADPSGPNTPPEIATGTLLQAHVGRAYFFQIEATDPNGDQLAFTISGGALPPGLSLSSIGTIYGVPTVAGLSTFTVLATDGQGGSAHKEYTLEVNTPPVWVTDPVLQSDLDAPYAATLQATDPDGDPVSFSLIGGDLPPGISFDPSGALAGTPTEAGTFTFTLAASDGRGAETLRAFSFDVSSDPIWQTPEGALKVGLVGESYNVKLTATDEDGDRLTYDLIGGSLLPGLSLSPQGNIIGTPAAPGDASFEVRVFDGRGGETVRSFSIVATHAPVWITPKGALAPAEAGAAYGPVQLQASDADGDLLTYTLRTGELPPGLTLHTDGRIDGIANGAGLYGFDVQVSDGKGGLASRCFTINVGTAPQWTPPEITEPAELPDGVVGEAYGSAIGARDPDGDPLTFAVVAGALPDGLTLNANTGAITGTPTTTGTSTFTIEVRDPNGYTMTRTFAIAVTTKPEWTTDGELPGGQQHQAYPALQIDAVDADGDTLSFSVDHDLLPKGMTLSSIGVLAGTPEDYGRFSFDSHVSDGKGGVATQRLSLAINAVPVWQTAPQLPQAFAGVAYGPVQLRATDPDDTSLSYSHSSGALPAGLTFDPDTATIAGTPTTGENATFTIVVSDGRGGTASRTFGIGENMSPEWVTQGDLPVAQNGGEYSTQIRAVDADPVSYTFMAGALPNGLALDSATGEITGTPTAGGSFSFTLAASDGITAPVERSFTLRVNRAPVWQTASDALPRLTVGAPYSYQLQASDADGDALSFALPVNNELPKGLSLSRDGLISGIPTSWPSQNFTVLVRDEFGGFASRSFTIIGNSAPSWTSPSGGALPGTSIGTSYTQGFTAKDAESDTITITLVVGVLPDGLSFDPNVAPGQARISGTPNEHGAFTFTLRATDALGAASERSFSIAVNGGPVWTTPAGRLMPNGTVGQAWSFTLEANDPDGDAITYSTLRDELPSGLSIDSSTGVIAGTPTEGGLFAFTALARDAIGGSVDRGFEIFINTPPTITTGSLPPATIGVPYSANLVASDPDAGQIVTFARAAGALPSGLAMNAQGAITGVPTNATGTFEVRAFDGEGGITYKSFTIEKNEAPVWTTPSGLLALATAGEDYAVALQAEDANNDRLTFTLIAGTLPDGLGLDANTGKITGIAAAVPSANHVFTVRVADASGLSASRTFAILTNNKPEWTTPAGALTSETVGQSYAVQLQASDLDGHALRYSLASGELPPGLSLSESGLISGTATQSGTYAFTAVVMDAYGATAINGFSIDILTGPIWATPSGALAPATIGDSYPITLVANSPYGGVTYAVIAGTLPLGLSLDAETGAFAGTPQVSGSFTFTVRATDLQNLTADASFSLFVNTPPEWQTAAGELTGTLRLDETIVPIQLQASDADPNQTLTFSLANDTALPPGFVLSSTGRITGTAMAPGATTFDVAVSDGIKAVSRSFTLRVNSAPTWITGAGHLEALYRSDLPAEDFQLQASDPDPDHASTLTFALANGTSLPTGLALSPSGVISGTPDEAGTYSFEVSVADSFGASATRQFQIEVTIGIGSSCEAIRLAAPSARSGVYTLDLDGEGGLAPFDAYCDMDTDAGGWTLVLNYLHKGGTSPAIIARTTDLPLQSGNGLGADESGTAYWGHAAPALLAKFAFTETRFACVTSAHARRIHFKTSDAKTRSYFTTGSGFVGNPLPYTALAGHSANLPASRNSHFASQGTKAMTEFPFYRTGSHHWGIGAYTGGNRWECDDYTNSPNYNTHHQIWIR